MNDAAHFLFIVGTLSTVLIAVLVVRAMLPKFFNWFRKTAFPIPKVLASTVSLALLAVFVISKEFPSGSFYSILQSPYVSLYSPSSGATLNAITNALSPAQYRARFALTSATNVTHDFSAPTNAVFCDLGPGVHDEAYWIPVSFDPEGTATNSRWGRAVCAAPSGMVLLDDVPDRLAPSLPDFSGAVTNRVLSILQTPSGLLPPLGKLWYSPTTNGSFLITWNHVFLGRDTNAVADLQLELLESGDFIYRLRLDENADASTVTNWLIAAQDNGGGEVFAFAENIPLPQLESDPFSRVAATNLIPPGLELSPQALELRWTSFGELDPGLSDNDDDGLSDWDELYIHHTDPGNPDTDGDGLADNDEISAGFSPLDADGDADGIADGIDAQPLVWNDADDDSDGDGLGLAFERLHGLDPATNDDVDTDGDGWEDWKEILAGTDPDYAYSTPLNSDGSCKIFDVTFTLNPPADGGVVVKVGDRGMVLTPASPTCTLTLREGIAHEVSLFTISPRTVSLSASIASTCAVFRNPHAVFSGTATLPGKWAVASGMIAQPVPDIEPEPICFHDRNTKHVETLISPEMPGSYLWWSDGAATGATGKSVDLLYEGGDTWVEVDFTADGATSARVRTRDVIRCTLLEEHPAWLAPGFEPEPPYPDEEPVGESDTGGPEFDAYAGSGLLVPVDNDDDDASETDDTADSEMSVADDDLVGYYPLGYFTGQCCPCPEHQARYADSATLVSVSSRLALYSDACKSNAFTGTIHAGEVLYVEGRSESASVGAEEIVWEHTRDNETHQITNAFTVLSQRIFGDLDFDDDIDTADKALHPALSSEFGWIMPTVSGLTRKMLLRTDVDTPGLHVLSLSGDNAFRIYSSGSTNGTPLLVSGQSITNGVNSVSFLSGTETTIYVEAFTKGISTLSYSFIGTGSASGIVCRASLRMTAFPVNMDGDYNRDGTPDDDSHEAEGVLFTNSVGMVILPNNNDNTNDSTPNVDCEDSVVNGAADLPDIYPLFISKLGVSVEAMPDELTFELRVSGTGDDALGAPEPKERVRIFASRVADAVGIIGPGTLPESIVFAKHPATNQLDIALLAGSGHLELGIEGIEHGLPVEVVFRAWINCEEVSHDAVCVQVAPFIVLSNCESATKVYLADGQGWNDFYGYAEDALDGVVETELYGGTAYIQDFAEIGASSDRAAQNERRRSVILGMADEWFEDKVSSSSGYHYNPLGNIGGNIEASPPIAGYPFGRVILGENVGSTTKSFFAAQKIQCAAGGNAIELPVGWLSVGHVDEVFTIIPTGNGYKVLVADLQLAIELLRVNPEEETYIGFPTRATLLGAYDNPANSVNLLFITNQLATVRQALAQGLGIDESEIVKVPVAFTVGNTNSVSTYLPNMVNMIVVRNDMGTRRLLIPDPCFVPYAIEILDTLEGLGYEDEEIRPVNTTVVRAGGGEAHCASSVIRHN